ncbi:hypothetical protein GN956_G17195 [Arapaima gigas]
MMPVIRTGIRLYGLLVATSGNFEENICSDSFAGHLVRGAPQPHESAPKDLVTHFRSPLSHRCANSHPITTCSDSSVVREITLCLRVDGVQAGGEGEAEELRGTARRPVN